MQKRSLAAAVAAFCLAVQFPNAGAINAAADSALEFSIIAPGYCTLEDSASYGNERYSVNIELSGNKGVQSWVLLLDYDSSKVTFDSISSGYFNGIECYDTGGKLIINDYETSDVSANGVIVTVDFILKPGVKPSQYDCFHLSLSGEPDDFFNNANVALPATVKESTAPLELREAPYSVITFESDELNMEVTETRELKLIFNVMGDEFIPGLLDASNWFLSVSNPAVSVSVENNRLIVTAVSPGKAVITATNPDYVNKNGEIIPVVCTVNVESNQIFEEITVDSELAADNADDVTFTLELVKDGKVKGSAEVSADGSAKFTNIHLGQYELRIKCSDESYAPKTTNVVIENDELTINDELFLYGDLNLDGERDLDDLINLQKIIAGWKIQVPYKEIANIDASADGDVSVSDLILFQKYIAGWDVSIGGQKAAE